MGNGKLVFVGLRPKFPVIARPVRRLVVAIPRLEGKCIEKRPEKWGLLRFMAVIVTWFLSTGGLPRQCEHWLAMTAYLYKHQFIALWQGPFMVSPIRRRIFSGTGGILWQEGM